MISGDRIPPTRMRGTDGAARRIDDLEADVDLLDGLVEEMLQAVEGARGEIGVYLVSDGSPNPYRAKWRSSSFSSLSMIEYISPGLMIADLVAVRWLQSRWIDPRLGEEIEPGVRPSGSGR